MIMSEADVLALTYYDFCNVYRDLKVENELGETNFEQRLVYENIECALSNSSTGGSGKINQTKSIATISPDYQLFIRPEIDIQPNDTVIITHLGKKTTYITGLATYYISHNNVALILKNEVV